MTDAYPHRVYCSLCYKTNVPNKEWLYEKNDYPKYCMWCGAKMEDKPVKLIYIAHPFGGEQENVDKVEKIITGLLHKHPDCTFYSPLHATGFFYGQLPIWMAWSIVLKR